MKVTPVSNQNFYAIPISHVMVKEVDANYKLYEITQRDKDFLLKLHNKIDLQKLMPKMPVKELNSWYDIIDRAIYRAANGYNKSILETYNNVTCGILNYSDDKRFKINYIATFPDKESHRVPAAGQILFNELFTRFINTNHSRIELDALRESAFSPISTYLKLGFGMCGGDSVTEKMVAKREKIENTIRKQNEFINKISEIDKNEVDLEHIINLN